MYGVSKLAYPYLQAVNIDGSAITATNILKKIFDGYVEVRTKAKGTANEILMSYKHLGSIMKIIELCPRPVLGPTIMKRLGKPETAMP